MFCDILRNVRNNVISWVEKNKRCVNAYKQALLRLVGGFLKIFERFANRLINLYMRLVYWIMQLTHKPATMIRLLPTLKAVKKGRMYEVLGSE